MFIYLFMTNHRNYMETERSLAVFSLARTTTRYITESTIIKINKYIKVTLLFYIEMEGR